MSTRNRSLRATAAAVGAGTMVSGAALLAVAAPASAAPTAAAPAPTAAAPAAAAACPAVRVFNLVGTFAFDGLHQQGKTPPPDFLSGPGAPDSALTNLSDASGGRADYFTINYPAAAGPGIFASEQAGVTETINQATQFVTDCPGSKIEIIGYSQGADAAGDAAQRITNNLVPGVTPDKLLASFLVGDPANQATQRAGYGTEIGPMTGAGPLPMRPTGFGANSDTTLEFCNPTDFVCDNPPGVANGGQALIDYLAGLGRPNPAHTQYAVTEVAPGLTTVGYVRKYILDHLPAAVPPPVTTTSAPPVTTTSAPPVTTTSAPPVTTTSAPPVTTTSAPPVTTTSAPPVTTTSAPPVTTSTPAPAVADPGTPPSAVTPFRIDTGLGANAPTATASAVTPAATSYPLIAGGIVALLGGAALLLGALTRRRAS